LEGSDRGLVLRYNAGIRVEGLRKTVKNLSQASRSPGRDLNPGPPEYKTGVNCPSRMTGKSKLVNTLVTYIIPYSPKYLNNVTVETVIAIRTFHKYYLLRPKIP
jgi:hypothetical protein